MSEKRVIKSTSRSSAECTDIILRATTTTRLIFRPMLVNNPHDHKAAVHGKFLYQRKGPKDEWEDLKATPLSALRKGEILKLDLHASEILTLFQELASLYKLHALGGIPFGRTELVPIDSTLGQLASLPPEQVMTYLSANKAVGEGLLSSFLSWALELQEPEVLLPRLMALSPMVVRNLNAAVGLGALKQALAAWNEHRNDDDEEYWQQTLTAHSFVLEQVFAWPMTIVKGKAYVGGKTVFNIGGEIVDFLMKNQITNNAALVEIKTPRTSLLGSLYRQGIYGPSQDLVGSIIQVATYRNTLQREILHLKTDVPGGLNAFDPRCIVIIGSNQSLGEENEKHRSFELFRAQTTGVMVITFDELFEKAFRLIRLLESPTPKDEDVDDFPES